MFIRWLRLFLGGATGRGNAGASAEQGIARLPFDRVRSAALRQLRNPTQFEVARPPRHVLPAVTSPDIRDLFAVGSLVKSTHGDLWFDDQYLTESHAYPCLKVGTDLDHTEVWVDVASGQAIWMEQVDGTWTTIDRHPSIWHYILLHCAEVYDYEWRSMS